MTRSHPITKLLHAQRGNTAILFALCLPVLLGFAALAVDLARLNMVKVELQNAADAASLAGASSLIKVGSYKNWSVAETTANTVAKQNYANAELIQDVNVSTDSGYWNIPNRSYNPSHVSILAGDVPAVRVTVSIGSLNLFFGRFLGTNGPTAKPVSARAIAMIPYPGGPFEYGIFSTLSLNLNTNQLDVTGSVHTNNNLNLNSNNVDITGNAEAHGSVNINANHSTIGGLTLPNADIINMPDYSAAIAAAAAAANHTYTGPQIFSSNQIYSNPIYVKDLTGQPGTGTLTVTANTVQFTGAVMADGNITFQSNVMTAGNQQVSFYSKNGNITIINNNNTINGVLYAPNGTITINSNNIHINGSVVGRQIMINANGLDINRTDYPITSLQGRGGALVQ